MIDVRSSVTGAIIHDLWRRGRNAASNATLVHSLHRLADRTHEVIHRSRLAGAVRRSAQFVRQSWLYRWLTAEPDADVVVIDLRETLIVGPILGLLDRLLRPLVEHGPRARVGRLSDRLHETFVERPVQMFSAVAVVALIANLLFLAGLGSPDSGPLGVRLVALSLALAGTRVTVSADELNDSYASELLVALLTPPEPPERTDGDDPPNE